MAILNIKPADSCKYDQISLGEIMLRLDPGEGRIRTARNFQVLEGGGEYNTSRGLCKGFGYLPKFVSVPTGIFLWCWEFISSPTLGDTN